MGLIDEGLLIDRMPLWLLFVLAAGFTIAAWLAGSRIGPRWGPGQDGEAPHASEIVGALLGLIAFLLALTFDMAAGRYGDRQDLAREEAEAIRMAYLGAAYAGPAEAQALRGLLTEYVRLRAEPVTDPAQLDALAARSAALHVEFTRIGRSAGGGAAVTEMQAQTVASLQEVVSLHHRRLALGTRSRTPQSVLFTLGAVIAVAMFTLGLASGRATRAGLVIVAAFAVCFSAVLVLISALDRPRNRLVQENQQVMAELRTWMDAQPTD